MSAAPVQDSVASERDSSRPVVWHETVATDGEARAGLLHTPHGTVPTPTFMPVGTQGSVKALSPHEVRATGAGIVLGNTYHLWLRPGAELVAEHGGLHQFARWPGAMLTDSGGFQAFSLAAKCKRDADGFTFRSHLDGSKCRLSVEEAVRVQRLLGADIAMQLDVCPKGGAPMAEVEDACRVTTAWATRFLAERKRLESEDGVAKQASFGIVQGGLDPKLRQIHADELGAMPFEGLALGGFSVGEPIDQMHEILAQVAPKLDAARPRYLMGVGKPFDLVRGVAAGVDMFDCVLPTRNARNGQALTAHGPLVVKNARFKADRRVLDEKCGCWTCQEGFSRAYLRHLFLAKEVLVMRLLSIHNLYFYAWLMREARAAIVNGTFKSYQRGVTHNLVAADR